MPFTTALDTTKYNALRGNGSPRTYKASQFLCVCSNTVIFAARINQATFTASFASVTFDTVTVGAYTAIEAGMTVYISRTSDVRDAYFEGRARLGAAGAVASSTVLNINETSVAISDDDYLFVVRDFRPFHALGRVSGGAYTKDYALTFSQLKPIISGLQSAYAGIVSGSPVGFTVAFAASAVAATSGATISSYAWTIPSGGTVTAGATNTANVTVRFDASATEYWVKLIVTDSGSRTQTRWIPVWAVPADLSTTVVRGFTGARIEGSMDNGWSANTDAFAGVSAMLDGTLCCIFDVEYYQETAYSLFSTVKFVGRFRKEANQTTADETYSTLRKTTFEIEGAAAQLARLSSPKITMRDATSPTVWDEINTLTIWRAIAYILEHSTINQSFSLSFDSTANTYRAFQLAVQGQNQYEALKDIASAINGGIEFAPTGEMRVVRDLRYTSEATRTAATVVADLTATDWLGLNIDREYTDTTGLVEASGGAYSPTGGGISATAVQEMLSIAPGVAQGNGTDSKPLTGQILTADVTRATAQAELNDRAANHFALSNGQDVLTVEMRGAYNWLVPAISQWYTWTIAAEDNRRGLVYTTDVRWLLRQVSIEHDNVRGNKSVSAIFWRETSAADSGVAGQTVVIPPQNSTPPILPTLPPFSGYPNFPTPPDVYLPPLPTIDDIPPITLPTPSAPPIPLDGNAVVTHTTDSIWYTRNFISTPIWVEITPDDVEGTIRDFAREGYGGYLLTSDGASSWVYYSANVFVAGGGWGTPTEVTGEYDLIRTTSTLGRVYIEGILTEEDEEEPAWIPFDYDLTEDDYDITIGTFACDLTPAGQWTLGVGFESTYSACQDAIPGQSGWALQINWNLTDLIPNPARNITIRGAIGGDNIFTVDGSPGGTPIASDNIEVDSISYFDERDYSDFWYTDPAENVTVTGISGEYCENCTQAVGLVTRFSDDYGSTFEQPELVGATATGGGLDSLKIGAVALVGSDGQVKKATSGSTWADYGDPLPLDFVPICLHIPRFQFGSTSSGNTSTTPQYLIASSVEDDDGATMYKVTSSGTVFTDITPVVGSDKGLAIGASCVWMPWWSGSIIFAVLDFGGSPRLVVSTNGGTSWTDRGILDDDALSVIGRKGDKTNQQLYLTNGGPAYSRNRGSSISTKSYPEDSATDPVIDIEVYG